MGGGEGPPPISSAGVSLIGGNGCFFTVRVHSGHCTMLGTPCSIACNTPG